MPLPFYATTHHALSPRVRSIDFREHIALAELPLDSTGVSSSAFGFHPFARLMSLLFHSPLSCTSWKLKEVRFSPLSLSGRRKVISRNNCSQLGFASANSDKSGVRAFFFNPTEDPIIKEAFKEPVAFMGGIFAGILRLDLEEEPLKEWVTKTVEAAGISEDEIDTEGTTTEAAPQQIEIE